VPTRSIPWPRILAERVAIVVSILLAFGIQAWWEGVQDREEVGRDLASAKCTLRSSAWRTDQEDPSEHWCTKCTYSFRTTWVFAISSDT